MGNSYKNIGAVLTILSILVVAALPALHGTWHPGITHSAAEFQTKRPEHQQRVREKCAPFVYLALVLGCSGIGLIITGYVVGRTSRKRVLGDEQMASRQ